MTTQPKVPLTYYTDPRDVAGLVAEHGVAADAAYHVSRMLLDLCDEVDRLEQENGELQTFRANGEAEEIRDLRADLEYAQRRVVDLEIKLHDARRAKK